MTAPRSSPASQPDERRTWFWVGAAAIALEAVYALLVLWPMRIWSRPVSPFTHLVGTFGVDRAGALRYVAIVLLLFAGYGWALWLVLRRRTPPPVPLVLGAAAVFCATLVLTHPLTSTDLFNYIAGARIGWVHHDNPLTTPPRAYPADRFVALVNNWRDLPSPYGPLWSLLSGVPLALGFGRFIPTVVAFKSFSAAFLLGAGVLAWATGERLRAGAGIIALMALTWNPLAVWHVAGNGHNDAVMAFFLALAAYLLARGLAGPALLAFAASALVKFATLLLVPAIAVWWWRSGRRPSLRTLAPWLAGCAALAALTYAPYWAGTQTFRGALDEGSYFTVSGPAALRGAAAHVLSNGAAERLAMWTGRIAFFAAYAALLWRLGGRRVEALVSGGALALAAYLLLAATYFAPWYVLWPLTLAVMVPWRREIFYPALALSLTSMSVLVWATWVRARYSADALADWYPMHALSFLSVAPLPSALWWRLRRPERRGGASADIESPVLQREVAGSGLEG